MAMRHHGCFRLLVCWLLAAGVAGCGFQPRGSVALPAALSVTFVAGTNTYGSLGADFTEALRARNVTVTAVRSEATAVLKILDNRIKKEVLSVNTSGRVLEYEVRQTIRFTLVKADNSVLVAPQTVSMSREYLFRSDEILAREREDQAIRHTLQKNLVNLAMLRIAAASR